MRPKVIDTETAILARVREGLALLPLSKEEIDSVAPKLVIHLSFLNSNNGGLRTDSTVFKFSEKIRGVAKEFAAHGLTEVQYLSAALKQPSLFTRSPATVAENIRSAVKEFEAHGLSERQYLSAALKQPPLFSQSPATVAANIRGVVKEFEAHGLTEAQYLGAALKKPSLFSLSPATVCGHIELAIQLFRKGAIPLSELKYGAPSFPEDPRPVIKWLVEGCPEKLSLADNNFVLRMAHHELFSRSPIASRNILTHSRTKIETEVAQHFGAKDMKTPVQRDGYDPQANYDYHDPAQHHHVLCRLIDARLIKSLHLTPDEPAPIRVDFGQFRRPTKSVLHSILRPTGAS